MRLLTRHRDPVALLRRDQVVGVLGVLAEVDLDPLDLPAERELVHREVVADRGAAVRAEVGGLVAREEHGYGRIDPALAHLAAVEVERGRAALPEAAAVVGELDPDLVLAGRDRVLAVDLEALQAEEVVTERRPALLRVDAPAAEGPALGDDHTL